MTAHPIVVFVFCVVLGVDGTKRPIIGILTQEKGWNSKIMFGKYKSFISAAYVKSVEASGARVVPIFINQPSDYYRRMVKSVNGLLFPGGSASFGRKNGYADAAREVFKLAKEVNDEGQHFPILAICLGFQVLFYLETKTDLRVRCKDLKNVGLPLDFESDFNETSLFESAPLEIVQILKTSPITANFHKNCLQRSAMKEKGMESWKVLSTNKWPSDSSKTFISSIESTTYPFVGLQFHPERNVYDWQEKNTHLKRQGGLEVERFFYDWLVHQSKRNSHSFESAEVETENLIFQFPTKYAGNISSYDVVYFLPGSPP